MVNTHFLKKLTFFFFLKWKRNRLYQSTCLNVSDSGCFMFSFMVVSHHEIKHRAWYQRVAVLQDRLVWYFQLIKVNKCKQSWSKLSAFTLVFASVHNNGSFITHQACGFIHCRVSTVLELDLYQNRTTGSTHWNRLDGCRNQMKLVFLRNTNWTGSAVGWHFSDFWWYVYFLLFPPKLCDCHEICV